MLIVIEEAFILALTLEQFRKHEVLVIQIDNILLLESKSRINHRGDILIVEELLQEDLVRLGLSIVGLLGPTLLVDEVLGLLPVAFDLPLAFENDVEVVDHLFVL